MVADLGFRVSGMGDELVHTIPVSETQRFRGLTLCILRACAGNWS